MAFNELDRDVAAARGVVHEHITSPALRAHCEAVGLATMSYAPAGDGDLWQVAGLLHDFDWEIHPTADEHPMQGAPILRERGYSEKMIRAIQSHASHSGVTPESDLEQHLFACDELSGFVIAVAKVRPTGLDGMKAKSVTKKLKTPSFAAAVDREEIRQGAELIGLELAEHVTNIIRALQPHAAELMAKDPA